MSNAAFRYPNFRFYLLARFLTTVSSEMQSVAVGWQIYGLTHKALDLGLVGLAQFLPGICLFLLTGTVADRIPREKIVRACSGGFALCSALLLFFTVRHIATPYPVYAVLLLNGTVRAFNAPASQAFLLVGALVLVPIILVYTGYAYWVFRGKVQPGAGYH